MSTAQEEIVEAALNKSALGRRRIDTAQAKTAQFVQARDDTRAAIVEAQVALDRARAMAEQADREEELAQSNEIYETDVGERLIEEAENEIRAAYAPAPTPAPVPPPAPVPVPPPAPAPTPEPPPAPPPAGLVTVTTNGRTFRSPENGPSYPAILTDTLDLSRELPQLPWSLFRDDVSQTIAYPMEGRLPTAWMKLPIYGLANAYSQWTPALVNGKVYTEERDFRHWEAVYPPSVTDTAADMPALARYLRTQYPLRGGKRGEAIGTGFSITRGHSRRRRDGTINTDPRLPLWIKVDITGNIWYLMRDGSMSIAGSVPLESYANDFSFWDFVAPDGTDMRSVFWITDTKVGKIIKARRVHDPITHTDTFVSEAWCQVPTGRRATSVRAIGSKLYVCDESGVIEFDALDKTVPARRVCDLPRAFWVDYTSDGRLVVATLDVRVYRVDPTTGNISASIGSNLGSHGWVQLEVDRNGTCGLKDTTYFSASHGIPINGPGVIGPDDKPVTWWATLGNGAAFCGDAVSTQEAMHYPWNGTIHPDEALMLNWGGAQYLPSTYAAVIPSATDVWPVLGIHYDGGLIGHALDLLTYGGVVRDAQPSFASMMNGSGGSLLGCACDQIAELAFDAAEAFVQNGMLSTIRQPLAIEDLKAFLYMCYRSSQRFLREGKPLLDGLFAYFATKS